MKVTIITIEGENVIISAEQFDWLMMQSAKVAWLEKIAEVAEDVARWDWSGNDTDCVADIDKLRKALGVVNGQHI